MIAAPSAVSRVHFLFLNLRHLSIQNGPQVKQLRVVGGKLAGNLTRRMAGKANEQFPRTRRRGQECRSCWPATRSGQCRSIASGESLTYVTQRENSAFFPAILMRYPSSCRSLCVP